MSHLWALRIDCHNGSAWVDGEAGWGVSEGFGNDLS